MLNYIKGRFLSFNTKYFKSPPSQYVVQMMVKTFLFAHAHLCCRTYGVLPWLACKDPREKAMLTNSAESHCSLDTQCMFIERIKWWQLFKSRHTVSSLIDFFSLMKNYFGGCLSRSEYLRYFGNKSKRK